MKTKRPTTKAKVLKLLKLWRRQCRNLTALGFTAQARDIYDCECDLAEAFKIPRSERNENETNQTAPS